MANLTVTLQQFVDDNGQNISGANKMELINGSVSSIPVIVKDAAGNTGIPDLQTSNFEINSASAPTTPITGFTITADPDTTNKAGYYVINITSGQPDATKYVLITVTKTTGDVTDKGSLFLDPASNFVNGVSVINYPVSFGKQKFVLGQVNQSKLLNTMSDAFNFVKAVSAGNCAITLKGANPLQSIVIPSTNTLVPVEVTIKDASGNTISGPQSVTIFTEAAPLTKAESEE